MLVSRLDISHRDERIYLKISSLAYSDLKKGRNENCLRGMVGIWYITVTSLLVRVYVSIGHTCVKRLGSSMAFVIMCSYAHYMQCRRAGAEKDEHILLSPYYTYSGPPPRRLTATTASPWHVVYTPRINIIVYVRRCTGPRQGQAIIAPERSDNIILLRWQRRASGKNVYALGVSIQLVPSRQRPCFALHVHTTYQPTPTSQPPHCGISLRSP